MWATRDALGFPWVSIARNSIELAVASLAAFVVVDAIGGLEGLLVSAIVYLGIFAVLVLVFERSLLGRSRSAFQPGPVTNV